MSQFSFDPTADLLGAHFSPGVDTSNLNRFELYEGFTLPVDHYAILSAANGISIYDGYFKLFGVGAGTFTDSVLWNEDEYWKFAWNGRASRYWCFGETAWGDQYAYLIESLKAGEDETVYFLDAVSMEAEAIAANFSEFWKHEFLRCALNPYDAMIVEARNKFGPLASNSHLVYMPSLLLGGTETVENIQVIDARSAMICNGDLSSELARSTSEQQVKRIYTAKDQMCRERLRIEWEPRQ